MTFTHAIQTFKVLIILAIAWNGRSAHQYCGSKNEYI